jgi:broad specificity phosphatase PhoE
VTALLWVRHASHDLLGVRLAGRMAGVSLNSMGSLEARRLGTWLHGARVDALYTSPLERCVETAAAIAEAIGREPSVLADLTEIDFGAWTGRPFEDLSDDAGWIRFNTFRSEAAIPGGESMREAQERAVALVERLGRSHPGETLALVTHGDVIKGVIAHALGIGLDHLHRFDIDPGSVSTLALEPHRWRVIALNESPEPGHLRARMRLPAPSGANNSDANGSGADGSDPRSTVRP